MCAAARGLAYVCTRAPPPDVGAPDRAQCERVGLMRTGFLYAAGLPDEEIQYRSYARVLDWAGGKPVTIRTVDAGGDKPVPGTLDSELSSLDEELARQDKVTAQRRAEIAAIHAKYESDKLRWREIRTDQKAATTAAANPPPAAPNALPAANAPLPKGVSSSVSK